MYYHFSTMQGKHQKFWRLQEKGKWLLIVSMALFVLGCKDVGQHLCVIVSSSVENFAVAYLSSRRQTHVISPGQSTEILPGKPVSEGRQKFRPHSFWHLLGAARFNPKYPLRRSAIDLVADQTKRGRNFPYRVSASGIRTSGSNTGRRGVPISGFSFELPPPSGI